MTGDGSVGTGATGRTGEAVERGGLSNRMIWGFVAVGIWTFVRA